jgi:hypothetical protein
VVLSGPLEFAGVVGLWLQRTQRSAAILIAPLMVAVFPADIHAAGQSVHGLRMRRSLPGCSCRSSISRSCSWPAGAARCFGLSSAGYQ